MIQLQTAFGGGKTHTMLTVFHLATRKVDTRQLMGIPPILDAAGIAELPFARVAVLDGIKGSCGRTTKSVRSELSHFQVVTFKYSSSS